MPRRTSKRPEPLIDINKGEEQLALPPPRVVTSHPHKTGEHKHDPYETPPGAIPGKVGNVETSYSQIKRKMTKADIKARDEARLQVAARAARYNEYIDIMGEIGGNKVIALARVYGISVEEAKLRQEELHADVVSGMAGTDVATILVNNDIDLSARAKVISKHMYSDNAAASLKAADMAAELEGDRTELNFEHYLRTAKLMAK